MERQDQAGQDLEQLMRRAAERGFDPERVERALRHGPPAAAEPSPVMQVTPRKSPAARLARRLARRPSEPSES